MPDFVVIVSQGRSGSTLLLRMLNAVPGVRISGENERALDHLREFIRCYEIATTRHDTEFYRLAWRLPCPLDVIRQKTASFVFDLYNPDGTATLVGFKEIRYGCFGSYADMCGEIGFIRQLIPASKIILNTRRTDDAIKSSWWTENPDQSRRILDRSRSHFERYHFENPGHTFLMPYEDIHRGSNRLAAMFDFLGLDLTPAAEIELDKKLR
jgi:hypothetical protein